MNAAAPGEGFEGLAHEASVGNDLGGDVDQRSESAKEDDDPKPIAIGATTNEVHNRHRLENQSPGKKQKH